MLKIRLQRIGKRGQAYFRVIVTEHTKKPQGKYLDSLGSYDPHKDLFTVQSDRVTEWLKKGAQPSATVHNLLIEHKLIEGDKVTSWRARGRKKGAPETDATAPAPTTTEASQAPVAEPVETAA